MPRPAEPRELADEIIRRIARSGGTVPYVVRLSDSPTAKERMELMACRILGRPIAMMPAECLTVEEWSKRYAPS